MIITVGDVVSRALLACARRRLPDQLREQVCDEDWAAEVHHVLRWPGVPAWRRALDAVRLAAGLAWGSPMIGWELAGVGEPAVAMPVGKLLRHRLRQADGEWARLVLFEALALPCIVALIVVPGLFVSVADLGLGQTAYRTSEVLSHFVAPVAAGLVGAMGIKFLRGGNKSLAGFHCFLCLAACVYDTIIYGYVVLFSLGAVVSGWLQ